MLQLQLEAQQQEQEQDGRQQPQVFGTNNRRQFTAQLPGVDTFERRKLLAQKRLRQNFYREYGYPGAATGASPTRPPSASVASAAKNSSGSSSSGSGGSALGRPQEDFDSPVGSTLAFATTATYKGLSNNSGDNNCFLNATIQALWHLGPFRIELQDYIAAHLDEIDDLPPPPPPGPAPPLPQAPAYPHPLDADAGSDGGSMGSDVDGATALYLPPLLPGAALAAAASGGGPHNLLRSMSNLFNQIEFGEEPIVSADPVRAVMSHVSHQFRVGGIADANETLEAVLERIHSEWSPACPFKDGGKCIGHTVFGGLLMEQAVCQKCGASSEPMLRSDFVHYVYAAELISLAYQPPPPPPPPSSLDAPSPGGLSPPDATGATAAAAPTTFGRLLRQCLAVSPLSCPSTDTAAAGSGPPSAAPSPTAHKGAAPALSALQPAHGSSLTPSAASAPCPGKV